jgi:hypothetical protein
VPRIGTDLELWTSYSKLITCFKENPAPQLSTESELTRLVGGTSPSLGFVVHLVISAIIGMSYGLLFRREAPDKGSGVAWGLLYGLVWWFLGPLTLYPVLLGGSLTWTTQAAGLALPSLIGHLMYGAATALAFIVVPTENSI